MSVLCSRDHDLFSRSWGQFAVENQDRLDFRIPSTDQRPFRAAGDDLGKSGVRGVGRQKRHKIGQTLLVSD